MIRDNLIKKNNNGNIESDKNVGYENESEYETLIKKCNTFDPLNETEFPNHGYNENDEIIAEIESRRNENKTECNENPSSRDSTENLWQNDIKINKKIEESDFVEYLDTIDTLLTGKEKIEDYEFKLLKSILKVKRIRRRRKTLKKKGMAAFLIPRNKWSYFHKIFNIRRVPDFIYT